MLSSRCILNMKRLLTWPNNPFKISSKFRKQPGSLSIILLNNKDKEESIRTSKIASPIQLNSRRMNLEQSNYQRHLVFREVVLCIYLNHCVFILRM